MNIIGHGNCYAGSDLSTLTKEDITINDTSCTIRIEEAKIINTVINPADFIIFIDEGDWTPEEVQGLKKLAVEKVKASAIKNGILEKANRRTEKLISDFIKSIGFKEVKVVLIQNS